MSASDQLMCCWDVGTIYGFGRRCDVTYVAIARQKTLALWVRWQCKDARRQANFMSTDHGPGLEVDCKCSVTECLDMGPPQYQG